MWDGNQQVIADVIDNQFYEADCYIRGTNLVAKYNFWNGKKSEYTYYTQNAHGDVVNLTDKDGKVTKSYKYDAFGVEKNIDENDTNTFRYCGEYYDKETATVYLRARNYNPSIGRFISRDSYDGRNEEPLSLNKYTYCYNNPVFYFDPTGFDSYIFYLPEWEDEAKEDKDDLENIYTTPVHIVPIQSQEDLEKAWNKMGKENGKDVSIDTVIINTHANPEGLGFGNGNEFLATDIKPNLNSKSMKNLILYGCNAGHLDHEHTNPASQFAEIINSSPVLASDGTVIGRDFLGKYKSKNDDEFKSWLTSERKNRGWTVYRSNDFGVSQVIRSYEKKLTVNQMIKKLEMSVFWGSGIKINKKKTNDTK